MSQPMQKNGSPRVTELTWYLVSLIVSILRGRKQTFPGKLNATSATVIVSPLLTSTCQSSYGTHLDSKGWRNSLLLIEVTLHVSWETLFQPSLWGENLSHTLPSLFSLPCDSSLFSLSYTQGLTLCTVNVQVI